MPNEITFENLRKESKLLKKYVFMVQFGRKWKVARKFTRKEILEYHKMMTGEDVLRSFIICLNTFDASNEDCVWHYNELKQELTNRISY